MPTYQFQADGVSEEFECEDLAEAKAEAISWGEDFYTDYPEETEWVHVEIYEKVECEDEDEDEDWDVWELVASVTATIEPNEPKCSAGYEHEFSDDHNLVGGCESNPGVWGNGGGVIIEEVCVICGLKKIHDTWAQDPNTGAQGLTKTSYEESDLIDNLVANFEFDYENAECVSKAKSGDKFIVNGPFEWYQVFDYNDEGEPFVIEVVYGRDKAIKCALSYY